MSKDEPMTEFELSYALAKHVPDIAKNGALFATNYGELLLEPEDSVEVAELVVKLLRKRLGR